MRFMKEITICTLLLKLQALKSNSVRSFFNFGDHCAVCRDVSGKIGGWTKQVAFRMALCFQFERNWLKCHKHLKLCILHYNESGVIIHITLNNNFLFNTRRTSYQNQLSMKPRKRSSAKHPWIFQTLQPVLWTQLFLWGASLTCT